MDGNGKVSEEVENTRENAGGADGGSIVASVEAQRAQAAHMQQAINGKPVGWGAKGYAADIAAGLDKANDEVRRMFYKNNPNGYRRFLEKKMIRDGAKLEAAAEYERANLAHAMLEDVRHKPDMIASELKDINSLFISAKKLNQGASLEAAQTARQEGSAYLATAQSAFTDMIGRESQDGGDEGAAHLMDVIAQQADEGALKVEKGYSAATGKAYDGFRLDVWKLFRHNENRLKEAYSETEKLALANGSGPIAAKAAAQSAIRKVSVGVLDSLLETGSYEVFEMWSENLKRLHMAEAERGEDGAVKQVSFDPMRKWCLTPEDISGLDRKYRSKLEYEKRLADATNKANEETALSEIDKLESIGHDFALSGAMGAEDVKKFEDVRTRLTAIAESGADSRITGAALTAKKNLDSFRNARESAVRTIEQAQRRETMRLNEEARQGAFDAKWEMINAWEKNEVGTYLLSDGGAVKKDAKRNVVDIRIAKIAMIRRAMLDGLCKGASSSGKAWSEILSELKRDYGASPDDLAEQANAYQMLKDAIGVKAVDKSQGNALGKLTGKKTKSVLEEWSNYTYNGKTYRHLTNGNEINFSATINGGEVLITGKQMNELAEAAAMFQRRHPNAKKEDIASYMQSVLEQSVSKSVNERGGFLGMFGTRFRTLDGLTQNTMDVMNAMLDGRDAQGEIGRLSFSVNGFTSDPVVQYEKARLEYLKKKAAEAAKK